MKEKTVNYKPLKVLKHHLIINPFGNVRSRELRRTEFRAALQPTKSSLSDVTFTATFLRLIKMTVCRVYGEGAEGLLRSVDRRGCATNYFFIIYFSIFLFLFFSSDAVNLSFSNNIRDVRGRKGEGSQSNPAPPLLCVE